MGPRGGAGGPAPTLRLGVHTYDLSSRALIMGILNRTPDSFYDRGAFWDLSEFFALAEKLVADGADILDVGGVKAGPGPEVREEEELDRVVPVVAALTKRFDVPVSVDTWRSSVAQAAYDAGALMGNDISGFADPEYLVVAAAAGAAVVATHIRLSPRVPDPDPPYDDVVATVESFLIDRARRAMAAGVPSDKIVLDAGLDLGKSSEQSLRLLGASRQLATQGFPLLLSASNKAFLGTVAGLGVNERREISLGAAALGISLGCRLVRVHDVEGTRRVRDALAAVLAAA